jgi:hypothetical protein
VAVVHIRVSMMCAGGGQRGMAVCEPVPPPRGQPVRPAEDFAGPVHVQAHGGRANATRGHHRGAAHCLLSGHRLEARPHHLLPVSAPHPCAHCFNCISVAFDQVRFSSRKRQSEGSCTSEAKSILKANQKTVGLGIQALPTSGGPSRESFLERDHGNPSCFFC